MAPGNALTPQLIAARPVTPASHPHGLPHAPRPYAHPARSHTADVRRFAFELPARAEAVARARRLVVERLARWGVGGDVRDTAELVVSELFTNAVVHTASGRVVCELRDRGEHVRIAVHDEGCRVTGPRLRTADREECGRGLLLVDAMCAAWGSHDARHGAGRVVWAELLHDTAAPC
ncbi:MULTISPECIES: ATP-binding protein [Streptomyces]|uniref:Histidine kinase-, DNA gyrase B-, and HSP90-like ATPase n=2 Tax=Streptomyces TaxID=1883 RepID=A0A1D8G9H6_9ACTN|nr:Histidine kinase-, DNA gyrase B-, and HSP90-like ATPase [Streptomyces rubrolavendulae]OSY54189.1 Histidine kinase-, DNA gyrase B-, and HSP90-like ATPase [Streptomyces fradiae ATCC 10745 = DSM 40063]